MTNFQFRALNCWLGLVGNVWPEVPVSGTINRGIKSLRRPPRHYLKFPTEIYVKLSLFFANEYLKDRRWCTSSWINIFFNFFARSLGFFVSWLWWQFCKSSGEWIKVLATAHFQPTSADTLISTKAKDFCKLITPPFNKANTLCCWKYYS